MALRVQLEQHKPQAGAVLFWTKVLVIFSVCCRARPLTRMHGVRHMMCSAAGLSSGLNLLQGFDGRMEAKLLREKLLIRGRVS